VIEEEGLVDNARVVGEHLLRELHALHDEFPELVSNARGRGLMCAFDLPDRATRDRFRKIAYQKGLLILGCGERSIRFRPSLNLTPEDCDRGIEIVRRCTVS